jgi:ferredoxin
MKYLRNVSTIELDTAKCTGCGICLDVCPHEVLALQDRKARIIDSDACMECGACVANCASGALTVDKGVGCAAALIGSMISGGEPTCGCSGDKGGCC